MEILAGDYEQNKVIFTGSGASKVERLEALGTLTIGNQYTVAKIEIEHPYVYLYFTEIPGRFNSVMFDNVPGLKAPKPIENPDFSAVIKECKEQMADIEKGEPDEDSDHYIYEAAMEAVFGKDVWDYINEKI